MSELGGSLGQINEYGGKGLEMASRYAPMVTKGMSPREKRALAEAGVGIVGTSSALAS